MTKEAAEKFAVEIEKIKAEAEAAIAKALKQAEQHKQDLNEKLYTAYTKAVGDLATANSNLLTAKADLLSLELGVISAEESAQVNIDTYERNIARYQAELEVLKDPKYTSVNEDSLWVLYQTASKKATLERDYFNASDVKKAVDNALEAYNDAKDEWSDEFWTVWGEYANSGSRYLPFVWEQNYNVVNINEENLYNFKNYVANRSFTTDEDVQDAKDALADAEALVATANKYQAELEPAVEAHDAAMAALALAWDKYNATNPLDTAAKATALANAKAAYKADTAALKALQKELAEVQGIQPKVKELTDAETAAKKAYDAAVKADAKADSLAAVKKAIFDTTAVTSSKYVAAAQAYADATADAAQAEADMIKAKNTYDKAAKAYSDFVTKYSTLLTGNATADAAAIKAKVAELNGKIYNKEIDILTSAKNLADAQEAYDKAKAAVVDPKAAAEALVAAEAAARTAQATLVALLHPEEDTEYAEMLSDMNYNQYPHHTDNVSSVVVDEDGTTLPVVGGLVDENKDGNPDFVADANGNANQGTTYAIDATFASITVDVDAFDADIVNLEKAVAQAKDDVTDTEMWLANEGGFIYEWKTNTETKEAELREWVADMNDGIEAVDALEEAYDEAVAAADEAEAAVIALEAEADALWTLYYDAIDINDQIQSLERYIARYTLYIEQAKNGIYDAEAQVELKKEEIAALEAEIEVLEKMVETAKANLDAAVAAE